ncbi:ACSL1 ligase, partial [Polyodon spathula]|nr:ACSL1 ligase [Polyodon spathula]
MQAPELLRQLRLPEFGEVRQYVRTLPTNTLMGFGAFAALTTYWYATRPKALKPPCDLALQSVEIEGGDFARRSVLLDSDQSLAFYYSDAKTMYDIFQRGIRVSNNGPCLGSRKPNQPYEWICYREVADRAEFLGSGLLHRGHTPTSEQFIGIFAQNRPEWTIAELACYTYSMVSVPLYDTLGPDAIAYILEKAEISTVICDTPEKAQLLLECTSKGAHQMKTIILMDAFDIDLVGQAKKLGIEVISLRELESVGKLNRRNPVPPKPDDLALICFTSGTTGNPKGAMLTHANVVSNAAACIKITENLHILSPEDVMMSFLPLAHMFERVVETSYCISSSDTHVSYLPLAHMFERLVQLTADQLPLWATGRLWFCSGATRSALSPSKFCASSQQFVILCHGARIGFFQGDIRLLMDDLKTLQPSVFPVVPRLLNRMFDRIFGQANTPLKRWLLDFATKRKEAELKSGIVRNDSVWDKLIFNKVQASLGGKVRLMITGAAPVSPTVLSFLRAALGCQFYEGYGQTECTAGCSMTLPGDWTAGKIHQHLALVKQTQKCSI